MKIRNWSKYQHYHDRCPPWIKVHRSLLDDFEWHNLDPLSAKMLINLWLLAAEDIDGNLPAIETMAFRLRIEKSLLIKCLSSLTPWLEELDSNVLANMEQSGGTETETETETDPVEQVSIEETFDRFWKLYPSIRKVAKQKCFERWKSKKYYKIADQIISHVETMKQSKQWKDGFSPAPITYIQQMRWLDDVEVERKPWEGGI